MKIFVCIDERNGTMFARRRQSQDKILREFMLEKTSDSDFLLSNYTAKQFKDQMKPNVKVIEKPLDIAEENQFVFAEGEDLSPYLDKISTLYLVKWNRDYPSDKKLDIQVEKHFKKALTTEIVGSSHKKITIEEHIKL